MSDDRDPVTDTPDVAAAELALGLLDGDERASALRRVLAEPGFAQAVEQWRAHLAQLFDLWPGMEAPLGIGERIERSLDGPPAAFARTTPASAFTGRLWQVATAISSLAAAALLAFIVVRPVPVPMAPVPGQQPTIAAARVDMLVAAIDADTAGAAVAAVYDPASHGLRLTAAALADTNRSAELWVIAGDGVPHSLGLLRVTGTSAFTLGAENRARIAAGAVLAVSLEPIGGSPTGLPTGPIVAKGALSTI